METLITTTVLGVLLLFLAIMNMSGNLSSLHWYHRQRVTEENRKTFGKLVGSGTLIIGVALILFGILYLISEKTQSKLFYTIGMVELIAGVIIGLILSFYAMIKYNKGIF